MSSVIKIYARRFGWVPCGIKPTSLETYNQGDLPSHTTKEEETLQHIRESLGMAKSMP
jgi:hypothetical protein